MIPWNTIDGMVSLSGCVLSVEGRLNCTRESLMTVILYNSYSVIVLILLLVGVVTVSFGYLLLSLLLTSNNSIFFVWTINSSLSLKTFSTLSLLETPMRSVTSASFSIYSFASFEPRYSNTSWILEELS